MQAMQIQPALAEDARAVAGIHVLTWQAAYPGIVPADYLASLSIDKYEAFWRDNIVRGTPQLLLAKEGGQALGWIAFGPSRDEGAASDVAEIWAIYVAAPQWARGVGRGLWRDAAVRMREAGFTSVGLWAFPENVRAGRFYESIGFSADPASNKFFELGGARLREIRYARSL